MINIDFQESASEAVYDWYVAGVSYFIALVVFIVIGISSWVIAVRMRRRIKKDLGKAVYTGDLASIQTWMKVDEMEERAGARPESRRGS